MTKPKMRPFALATIHAAVLAPVFAMAPILSFAQGMTGTDWQLLAIDGQVVDIPATLRIEEDGRISGKAPCNGWSAQLTGTPPDLKLFGLRATRMACDRLADEQLFFDALVTTDRIETQGDHNLVLSGPDGRNLEFVYDLLNSLTVCRTCKAPP